MQRAPIQTKIIEILQDGEWWKTPKIQHAFAPRKVNTSTIHMALNRLAEKGILETKKPPAFGNPVRLWRLNKELVIFGVDS